MAPEILAVPDRFCGSLYRKRNICVMENRLLAFELRFEDGRIMRLYDDGRGDGIPANTRVVNYVPALLSVLRGQIILKDQELRTLRGERESRAPEQFQPQAEKNIGEIGLSDHDSDTSELLSGSQRARIGGQNQTAIVQSHFSSHGRQ